MTTIKNMYQRFKLKDENKKLRGKYLTPNNA